MYTVYGKLNICQKYFQAGSIIAARSTQITGVFAAKASARLGDRFWLVLRLCRYLNTVYANNAPELLCNR